MKKKYFLISFTILLIVLTTVNFRYAIASDDDDDGIDDDFEELNKRNISIEFLENETEVTSILKNGKNIDSLIYDFKYDENGLEVDFSYNSGSEVDLEFSIEFHEIVEYLDNNGNGIYDSEIDSMINTLLLNDFNPINYSIINITNDARLHYLRIATKDNNFTTHIYFSEEFAIINNTIITPNQAKINIEITDFNFLNNNSKLALYTKLNSELDFVDDNETEDEKEGYASNERGVSTTINKYTGYFSWKENATVDNVSKEVLISILEADEHDANEQRIYINYLQGNQIFHDPKVGIEDLWRFKTTPFPLTMVIIIILIIGAISVSIAYSVYHYTHTTVILEEETKRSHRKSLKKKTTPFKIKAINQLFEKDNLIQNLSKLEDINLTAVSADFLEKIHQFEWEEGEKDAFINEMLALSPDERDSILSKMLKDQHKSRD
ncbi:MAG: hypothetical protein ACFFDB_07660 [Promethearchaeota archaeon]